jgi:hypothetical protein
MKASIWHHCNLTLFRYIVKYRCERWRCEGHSHSPNSSNRQSVWRWWYKMLKATSETICLPLSTLFRYSLQTCKFPSYWKLARVMPSFKKDVKSSPSNYRPISLLSWVGKVMERVVHKYIYNYIIEHSLLYSYQSGFLPGHSTV